MINRKIQPKFKTSESLEIINVENRKLLNNIPVHIVNAGNQDVVKIDFIFDAGTIHNNNPLIADSVNALLEAGTKTKSSVEIAETLDFYGAYLELNIGNHFSQIILYSLNKYLEETLDIIEDIIFNSIFPENEVDIYIKNRLQKFSISRQKTDVLSQELFSESIFGSFHPYGRKITEKDFNNINSHNLNKFYKEKYLLNSLKIIMSGKVEEYHVNLLNERFGKHKLTEIKKSKLNFKTKPSETKQKFVAVDGAMQTSIKVGKKIINRNHPDFFNLNITSIILGGYFGSRLMNNIREDKGYTYGIYAGVNSLLDAGFFSISAESGKEVFRKAIDEIYKELKILRTSYVSDEELSRVKNYLTGNFHSTFDGAFSVSDAFKSILFYGFNLNYYNQYFDTIKKITPQIIKETAEKYLNENSMYEITVGTE
ncbi:MAG: insulinase family protein [Bacteroidales bacterium]|nr:insulinase family protein [Bacteroidales bacterium]